MNTNDIQVSVQGQLIDVPSVEIDGRRITVNGTLLKTGSILDEDLVAGELLIPNHRQFVSQLERSSMRVDIFTFAEKVYQATPRYPYHFELDNAAVARIASYDEWLASLPKETRKNHRRAVKRGVETRVAEFDEEFVRGIKGIYDENPIRQGRRFWHYGKDVETIRRENSTYPDRSAYVGAYYEGQLIGFVRLIYVDQVAYTMQVLAMTSHFHLRPMNSLIAKTVELCCQKHISYLAYSKFNYGKHDKSPLAEFKRRNGFLQMDFPRYYVPLTRTGKLALGLRLHRGMLGLLPPGPMAWLPRLRAVATKLSKSTSPRRDPQEAE